uniref:Peptidase_M13_N domain-containing protein n=1 Tax=Strongyloides papillosus TaxID=174720 RepID=A0A0N5BY86_STREA
MIWPITCIQIELPFYYAIVVVMGRNNLITDISSNIPYSKLQEKIESEKKSEFHKFIIKNKQKSSKCIYGIQLFFALIISAMIIAYFTIYILHPFQYYSRNHYSKVKAKYDDKENLFLSDMFDSLEHQKTCDPISNYKCKINGDEGFWTNTTFMLKKYLYKKGSKDVPLKKTVHTIFDKCLKQTLVLDNKVKHIKQSLNSIHRATDIAFYLSDKSILKDKFYSRNVITDTIGLLDRIFDSKILFSSKLVYTENISSTSERITSIKTLYKISPIIERFDYSQKEENLRKIIEVLKTFGIGNRTYIDIAANEIMNIDQMLNDRSNPVPVKNILIDLNTAKVRWSSLNFEDYFLRMTSGNVDSMAHIKSRSFQFIIKDVNFFDRLEILFSTGAINQVTLGNYVLYKFIVERMQMPGYTREVDCTRLIASTLPLLTLKIYNNELNNYESDVLEDIAEDHVEYTTEALEIIATTVNNFTLVDKQLVANKIQNMRVLMGAPRWIFNDNHLIKYHEGLDINENDEFNNIVYKLREFSLFKMQESLYKEQLVDEYLYVHQKISANRIYYCPFTNTLMIPSSALLSLREDYDNIHAKNNLFNAKIALELAKIFTHIDNGFYINKLIPKFGKEYGPVTRCMHGRLIDLTDIQFVTSIEIEESVRYAAAIQIAYVAYKNIQLEEEAIFKNNKYHRNVDKKTKQRQNQIFFDEILPLYCQIPNEYLRGFTANSLFGFTPYQATYECSSTKTIGTCNLWTSFYKL